MGKLTKEQIHEVALKYELKQDFRVNHYSLFSRAKYNGWWKEISSHMRKTEKVRDRTIVECQLIANKYTKLVDFIKSDDVKYYVYAKRRNWLDEITQHMDKNIKWLPEKKDEVIEEGGKYEGKYQFCKNSPKHYYAARAYGWIDEIEFKKASHC